MDNYREKIVRIVERELERTEEYQQRRDEYGNEEYILGCIMVKGDAFPKEVIAHALVLSSSSSQIFAKELISSDFNRMTSGSES